MPLSINIDRLFTLQLAKISAGWSCRTGCAILMYHSVGTELEAGVRPYYRTTTSPQAFRQHMLYLHDHGYRTIDLTTLATSAPTPNSEPLLAITFDDGYQNFYSSAFPILNEHGFTATVYLPTAFISRERKIFKKRLCMTWDEVRELSRHGISFGSHTVTHPQLHDLSSERIQYEITVSKDTIEQQLGMPVESFAYPFAFPETDTNFVARLRGCLASAGYRNGVCTSIGRVDKTADPFFMKRLPVNSCDDLRLFEAKLAGAYDWVAVPQRWMKRAKSVLGKSGAITMSSGTR